MTRIMSAEHFDSELNISHIREILNVKKSKLYIAFGLFVYSFHSIACNISI